MYFLGPESCERSSLQSRTNGADLIGLWQVSSDKRLALKIGESSLQRGQLHAVWSSGCYRPRCLSRCRHDAITSPQAQGKMVSPTSQTSPTAMILPHIPFTRYCGSPYSPIRSGMLTSRSWTFGLATRLPIIAGWKTRGC